MDGSSSELGEVQLVFQATAARENVARIFAISFAQYPRLAERQKLVQFRAAAPLGTMRPTVTPAIAHTLRHARVPVRVPPEPAGRARLAFQLRLALAATGGGELRGGELEGVDGIEQYSVPIVAHFITMHGGHGEKRQKNGQDHTHLLWIVVNGIDVLAWHNNQFKKQLDQ